MPPIPLSALSGFQRRLLGVVLPLIGPRASYAASRVLARRLYRLLLPLRVQAEATCRTALAGRVPADEAIRIAEASFVHRIWNFIDLYLADRLLHRGTYARFGGRIPPVHHERLLGKQQRREPVILLTAYYSSFDLLPVFLGFNGVRAVVPYKRHVNAAYDAYRLRIRRRGGCELVALESAMTRLTAELAAGGTVAFVADHRAERRGVLVRFMGMETTANKAVGLLAQQFGAEVVVSAIRRTGAFRFAIDVEDVIKPAWWEGREDALAAITHRYMAALERIVHRDPTQYLWFQPRWGEVLLREIAGGAQPGVELGARNG